MDEDILQGAHSPSSYSTVRSVVVEYLCDQMSKHTSDLGVREGCGGEEGAAL